MITYSIDDGNGNQLTAGLQSYDTARRVAQRRANDLGATVYLYEQGRVADDENDVEGEPEAIKPEVASSEAERAFDRRQERGCQ